MSSISTTTTYGASSQISEVRKPSMRIPSIDVLRGFAMIFMALDHTRDFFSAQKIGFQGIDHLATSYYFTRWITHLCAPTFIFLAGLAAYLQLARGKSKRDLSFFLFTRGLWLILLEVTVVGFSWVFAPSIPAFQVIWAIGVSMIFLAGIIWLPLPAIAAVGIAFVAGHNLFDGIHAASLGHWADLWHLVHEPGFLLLGGKPVGFLIYPVVPWNGVMALGFCFGRIMTLSPERRIRATAICGACLLAIFVVLRALHAYGDPNTWTSSEGLAVAIKGFLNVDKYPPSLQYCAVTLGLSLLLLAWFDSLLTSGRALWLRKSVEVYGRVPLAYYILHLYVIHALTLTLCGLTTHNWRVFIAPLSRSPLLLGFPPGYGFSLPAVYAFWIVIVFSLYWPMRRYAEYKQAHPEKRWLSYL